MLEECELGLQVASGCRLSQGLSLGSERFQSALALGIEQWLLHLIFAQLSIQHGVTKRQAERNFVDQTSLVEATCKTNRCTKQGQRGAAVARYVNWDLGADITLPHFRNLQSLSKPAAIGLWRCLGGIVT